MVLRVTGPGIDPPVGDQRVVTSQEDALIFDVNVPVGNARVFEVEAFPEATACQSASLIPNFIPNFSGEEVANIPASGATVTVLISLVREPVVRPPTSQDDLEGTTVVLQIVAADPTGAPLTFDAANLPPGLRLDPATGLITGTLPNTAAGEYEVTITVSSSTGSDSTTFTWTVTNPPLTLTSPGPQISPEGTAVVLQLTANDPDGDPLTFSAQGLPPGLSIDVETGLITGTLSTTAAAGAPYLVTVTATDGIFSASVTFTWDVLPGLSISDVLVTEGDEGAVNAVFTVTMSAARSQPVTVAFATANGTATAGSDYQATGGTLTFPPGTTIQTITVNVLGDTVDEGSDETFLVNLSSATNATIADAQGVGTIQDDDLDVHFTSPVPVYGLLGARASSPLLKQAGRLRSQGTGSEFTKQTSRLMPSLFGGRLLTYDAVRHWPNVNLSPGALPGSLQDRAKVKQCKPLLRCPGVL
jgi:PKD repeat protein